MTSLCMRVLLCAAVLIPSGVGRLDACYTGLTVIPTAEVLDHGEYGLEQQFDGAFAAPEESGQVFDMEFGLLPRLEAGVDFDLAEDSDTRVVLNAKYLVCAEQSRTPAVALGFCDLATSVRGTSYLVATKGFGPVRGHVGVMRMDGRDRWFAGSDLAQSERLTLMADYVSGAENASSVGASYQVNDRFGVMAGVVIPNEREASLGFTLHLVLNGPFSTEGEGR